MSVESWAGDRSMGLSIIALGLGETAWDPNASNRTVDVGQRRVCARACKHMTVCCMGVCVRVSTCGLFTLGCVCLCVDMRDGHLDTCGCVCTCANVCEHT